ncbi:MAG: hypothetical protein WBO46_07265 [Caldilineaceae bacterium]
MGKPIAVAQPKIFSLIGIGIGLLIALLVISGSMVEPLSAEASGKSRNENLPVWEMEVPGAESTEPSSTTVNLPVVSADPVSTTNTLFIPLVSRQVQLSTRLGFGQTQGMITRYPEIESLRAGWYLNWSANLVPVRPAGMEYAQMIRLHQDLECPNGTNPDRIVCPYTVPYSYTYRPSATEIAANAAANPGSLWLLGNEMDRMDWFGSQQDEMLPELYAVAYHELYTLIKDADPLAKVAIGGIVQPTPLRLEYLTKVWDTYQLLYGVAMPVDVWNTHAFILREKLDEWGASIPPGSTAIVGEYDFGPLPHPQHIDMTIFDKQIRDFRRWMKERGQQEKPLIITEYGVLYHNWMLGIPDEDSQTPINFMLDTFDYFLNTADCSLGYTADDCRLVQRWVWFSLDYKIDFNKYHYLFDPDTLEITATGKAFREYSLQHMSQLSKKPY